MNPKNIPNNFFTLQTLKHFRFEVLNVSTHPQLCLPSDFLPVSKPPLATLHPSVSLPLGVSRHPFHKSCRLPVTTPVWSIGFIPYKKRTECQFFRQNLSSEVLWNLFFFLVSSFFGGGPPVVFVPVRLWLMALGI